MTPDTVTADTPPPVVALPHRDEPIGLDEAVRLTGRGRTELRQLWGLSGGEPQFEYGPFLLWAWRMGLTPYLAPDGTPVRVIGYPGIAALIDIDEQSVRRRVWLRRLHVRVEGRPRFKDIPAPILTVAQVALFNLDEIEVWVRNSGRGRADGTTRRLRPRREAVTGT